MRRPIWEEGFLTALRLRDGNVSKAADFSGAPRGGVYYRYRRVREFRDRVDAVYRELETTRTRDVEVVLGDRGARRAS